MSDLDWGPKDYESSVLTDELMAQGCTKKYVVGDNILEIFGQWRNYNCSLHCKILLHKIYYKRILDYVIELMTSQVSV